MTNDRGRHGENKRLLLLLLLLSKSTNWRFAGTRKELDQIAALIIIIGGNVCVCVWVLQNISNYYSHCTTANFWMASCEVTACQLLKLSIVACIAITLINGNYRDLTSAADLVRMAITASPLNQLLLLHRPACHEVSNYIQRSATTKQVLSDHDVCP